jgi:uncharacterized membrane protein YkvA (DUF1232 family)
MTADQEPAEAQFPREAFAALIKRLPAYGRLAWALARDPRVSKARRLAVLAGAAYVVSPVDLIPGFIPLAGQLDDLLVALGAIRVALDGLKPEWRSQRLAAAGLSQAELDADFRTTREVGAWMVRSGANLGRRLAGRAVEVGTEAAGRAMVVGRSLASRLRRKQ